MTTSARPNKLNEFVTGTPTGRQSVESDRTSVSSLSWQVRAASDGDVDIPALTALLSLFDSMGQNETFVETIRAELVAADNGDGNGPVTIGDASIAAALASKGVGTPPAEIVFDPISIVGIPQTSGFVDDPICAANGNMIHQERDLEFPAIAGALDVVRTYNSLRHARTGAFGHGWSSILDCRMNVADDSATVELPDGAVITAIPGPRGWQATSRRIRRIDQLGDGFEVHLDHDRRLRFDAAGLLTGWDAGVGTVTVDREGGRFVTARESVSGRSYHVSWSGELVAALSTSDGHTVDYERDADGRITAARSPFGVVRYEWDDHLLRAAVDADGVAAFVNVYDESARVVQQTSPFGRVTSYRYEAAPTGAAGSVTVISDQQGVRQAMIHDGRGNLTSVIDVDGSAMRITYDDHDRAVHIVDKAGSEWRYAFDEVSGDLTARVDPDGLQHTWERDELGRVTRSTDRSGAVTSYEYTGSHRAATRITYPDGAVSTSTLDATGRPIVITDADGVSTFLEYDADGQVSRVSNAAGTSTAFSFDGRGMLTEVVDPGGVATLIEYDRGRISRSTRGSAVDRYERTAAGRISAGELPGGERWSAIYGAHGDVTSLTDGLGSTVMFERDVLGGITEVTAPDGAVYLSRFDSLGRLTATEDPTGATSTMRYDANGNLVEIVDPDGNVRRRTVDAFGRTVESVAPDGATTRWTHHPNGEVATVTAADGRSWSTELDACGRVVAVVAPGGGRSTRTYSAAGRLVQRTSPAGRTEHYEYDDAGRCVAVTGTDGVRREVALDSRGQAAAIETSAGATIPEDVAATLAGDRMSVVWDDEGRIIGYGSDEHRTQIRRDAAGRVVATTDATGVSNHYEWDERGQMRRAVDSAGATIDYDYDIRGRLCGQTVPGGRRTSWEYDSAGFVGKVVDPAGVVTEVIRNRSGAVTGMRRGDTGWDRTLDAVGREVERMALDGTVLGRYDYDLAGRLVSAVVPAGSSDPLATTFLWDDDDWLSSFTDASGTNTIERDADGWPVAFTNQQGVRTVVERDEFGRVVGLHDDAAGDYHAVDVDIARDLAGRLLVGSDATVYRYDDAGRLAEIAPPDEVPTQYVYGDDGLVVEEHGPLGDRTFSYDDGGRVVGITVRGTGTTDIDYDSAGRRSTERRPDGSTTTYRWDARDQLVGIVRTDADGGSTSIDLELDALGRPQRINGRPVGYDPLGGRVNLLGDVRVLSVGDVTWRSDRPEWQLRRSDEPAGVDVGGLVLLGARVYDPLTRQFLSSDPLMTVAGTNGQASAYTYAWQDPVNFVDPTGLQPVSKEAYDAMRQREEQGAFGQAWEAIKEDPWGSIAMGLTVVAGVGLLFVPGGQAIGAGILIGVAMSAGTGLATKNFNPRQVALSGVAGGLTGGVGAMGASVTTTAISGAVIGGGQDLASQMINGQPIDWGSVGVSTALNAATFGIGAKIAPSVPAGSPRPRLTDWHTQQAALNGAALDGSAEAAKQLLTGDHTVNPTTVALTALGGGAQGANGHIHTDHSLPTPDVSSSSSGHGSGSGATGDGGSASTGTNGNVAGTGNSGRAPLAIEPPPPRLAIEAPPPRLAIEAGRTPLAIEPPPPRLAIEAGRTPLAIEPPPPRLAIEAPPTRLALPAGSGG